MQKLFNKIKHLFMILEKEKNTKKYLKMKLYLYKSI